ncbi:MULTISPECIES: VOC family protein [Bacillus]|uniref:Glyoxalase n=2 Tax=Bacillus TaxID=1386 RepID=A0A0M4FJ05_9BACI|nr:MULTISPECIES: VOC family protein [Bacillus]ALC81367.1 glyoxalase [Bacillus gobiensis]MBP1080388.1 putative enzyme related to lactoylglutathione lyase [Bacillus capparidis]MED1094247.1 VOC family protein [Bacillus capparidis]
MAIKYVHTNIIANDWEKLANFDIEVFNCKPLYPERNLSGGWIEKVTNIDKARIKGIHLRLPGYNVGPTLEIFQYDPENLRVNSSYVNQQGYGHIAFHVDDVEKVLTKLIEHGGEKYGELVNQQYESLGLLTVVYAKDPEGNIIEIQNWKS